MKNLLRSLFAASVLVVAGSQLRAAATGYVDLGKFKPTEGCEFVEVNLHNPLLKFAAMFVDKNEPDAAQLIRSLQHVRVNVVGYNDSSREDTAAHVRKVRQSLEGEGWQQIVTVQQSKRDEDVAIYVKMTDDDSIAGLVVTVIDPNDHQAVFVNVVGNIKPEQLAKLGKGLHIEPLAQLHAPGI